MKNHAALPARIIGIVALLLATFGTAQASLVGETVDADYHWNDLGEVLYPGAPTVVTNSVEYPNLGGSSIIVDFQHNSIRATFPLGWSFGTPGTFDGLVFSILSSGTQFLGASLADTNIANLPSAIISFDATHVYANLQNTGNPYAAGSFILINVSTVPEPEALGLIVMALLSLLVFGLMRRRAEA